MPQIYIPTTCWGRNIPRRYKGRISEVEDIMALKTIKVDDIAQRVLLDDIDNSLKSMRADTQNSKDNLPF